MKTCSKCGVEKENTEFSIRKESGKLRGQCNSCRSEKMRGYYDVNKVKICAREAASRAAAFEKNPRYRKEVTLKQYGLSLMGWDSLLENQAGVCAICKKVPGKTGFYVDHDHSSGRVRGLLCGKCNLSLGLLNDSIDILRSAIGYLEKSKSDVHPPEYVKSNLE